MFTYTPEQQLKLIKENVDNLVIIRDPTEEVQLLAVQTDPKMIRYIKNPSLKVQEMAVKDNPFIVVLVDNPSSELANSCLSRYSPILHERIKLNDKDELLCIQKTPKLVDFFINYDILNSISAWKQMLYAKYKVDEN